jgi:RHS repeat-associated protein
VGFCDVTLIGPTNVVAVFGAPLEFYHLDVLGSVRMVTNMAGAVVKRHDYFAFGEDIMPPTGDPRRFTGKERDPETELHYFGARYYRSMWGRFTSVDPVMDLDDAVVDPQRWNRYAYVTNRPTQFVDPDGRAQERYEHRQDRLVKAWAEGKISTEEYKRLSTDTGPKEVAIAVTAGAVAATVVVVGGGAIITGGTTCALTPSCNQAVTAAIEGLAPGSAASRGAFEVAKAGGKHAGMLANYAGRSLDEILSGIASYERKIAEHLDKLANPAWQVDEVTGVKVCELSIGFRHAG